MKKLQNKLPTMQENYSAYPDRECCRMFGKYVQIPCENGEFYKSPHSHRIGLSTSLPSQADSFEA